MATKQIYKASVNYNTYFLVLAESTKQANALVMKELMKNYDEELDTDDFGIEITDFNQMIPTEEEPVVEYEGD